MASRAEGVIGATLGGGGKESTESQCGGFKELAAMIGGANKMGILDTGLNSREAGVGVDILDTG